MSVHQATALEHRLKLQLACSLSVAASSSALQADSSFPLQGRHDAAAADAAAAGAWPAAPLTAVTNSSHAY